MSSTQTTTSTQSKTIHQLKADELPPLFVNDGELDPKNVGLLQPTDSKTTSPEEVRRRLRDDGYCFLKNVIPREDVLQARERYFKFMEPSGVLKPGTAPVDGIFDDAKDRALFPGLGAGPSEETEFVKLAAKAHTEPWYCDEFVHHPALKAYVAKVTGWGENTLTIQRTLLRNNTPKNNAIGVHYDLIFLRHGDDSVLTAWVPMGDIKVQGGGLIYLEKGHTLGEEIEEEFTARAKAGGLTDEEAKNAFNSNMRKDGFLSNGTKEFGEQHNRRWLVTGYEAGDVVLHSSYAIHASTINHDEEGVIRLGTDLRYVDSSRKWDTRWTKPFDLHDGL